MNTTKQILEQMSIDLNKIREVLEYFKDIQEKELKQIEIDRKLEEKLLGVRFK